ncbi:MAG: ferritin-like domain-containing protein [Prochlorothrix sp.]|nr:ferritin-like domain-containing protein [Prochlorothrix sp.]
MPNPFRPALTSGFTLPSATPNPPHPSLQRLLQSALGQLPPSPTLPVAPYWNAAYFGLDRIRYVRAATPEQQTQILQKANQDILEEIYWVELAGVGYMSKMSLLAETRQERSLYGLFAADEATHLSQIQPVLGYEPQFGNDGFLCYLEQVLESGDRLLLMVLVQVILEGWGLSHYRSLAQACQVPSLSNLLREFLQAEARHHALGVTQVKTQLKTQPSYSAQSLTAIEETLRQFLHHVQGGPQRLLTTIEQTLGHLSKPQKIHILEDIDTLTHSNQRLAILRSLLTGVIPPALLQTLSDQGAFQAYPPELCVEST